MVSSPKISGRRGRPTNYSSCQKTRMNDLPCGVIMWAEVSFLLSQSTHLTDRQMDRKALAISCVALHASRMVKIVKYSWTQGCGVSRDQVLAQSWSWSLPFAHTWLYIKPITIVLVHCCAPSIRRIYNVCKYTISMSHNKSYRQSQRPGFLGPESESGVLNFLTP